MVYLDVRSWTLLDLTSLDALVERHYIHPWGPANCYLEVADRYMEIGSQELISTAVRSLPTRPRLYGCVFWDINGRLEIQTTWEYSP